MFDFMRPYKLIVASENYVAPTIVVGVRLAKRPWPEGGEKDAVEFLTVSETGHVIFGAPEGLEGGAIQVKDVERKGDDGEPVVWRFLPLTLELWTEMGEEGSIVGFEKLKWQIQDEGTLTNFYIVNFLEDFWLPDYKAVPR